MVKVLAVCGNGMGTSMIIKIKVAKFLKENNIEALVESCSLGEMTGQVQSADVILCSQHLVGQIRTREGQRVIGLKNLLDEKEFGPQLLAIWADRAATPSA